MPDRKLMLDIVTLNTTKKAFEDRLKDINEELETKKEHLREQLIDEGVASVVVTDDDGNRLAMLSMSKMPFVKIDSKEALTKWVKQNGFEGLLSINYQVLQSWFKEGAPDTLKEKPEQAGLSITNKNTISIRK